MFPELTVAVTLSPLPERQRRGEGFCHLLSVKLNTEEYLEASLEEGEEEQQLKEMIPV